MKATLNVHPRDGVRAFEELYPQVAKAMNIDPESGEAVQFDLTDPKFMESTSTSSTTRWRKMASTSGGLTGSRAA